MITDMDITDVISRLEQLIGSSPPMIRQIDVAAFSSPRQPGKWSPKQILGHLVDSAANNHQRLIRAIYMERPEVSYDQVQWNALGHYDSVDSELLLRFWESYNLHLVHLFRHLSVDDLSRKYLVHDVEFDLARLAVDYLEHLEHHLHQILAYRK